jgi:hypothetical protein
MEFLIWLQDFTVYEIAQQFLKKGGKGYGFGLDAERQ